MSLRKIVTIVALGGGIGLGSLGVGAGLASAEPVSSPPPPSSPAEQTTHRSTSPWEKFGLGWGDPWYNPGVNDSLNLGLLGHHGKH
ncbi:hypothetical protein [Rhodococcus sp. WMMA185]|uniref:hypothetical protein n=1 Tax=Rhodococcus sp. WMMA185 TaxID=679318 RepID=UPI0012F479E2|nr:hypothetical protein [Rhodococcus sp. WMMA185]